MKTYQYKTFTIEYLEPLKMYIVKKFGRNGNRNIETCLGEFKTLKEAKAYINTWA